MVSAIADTTKRKPAAGACRGAVPVQNTDAELVGGALEGIATPGEYTGCQT